MSRFGQTKIFWRGSLPLLIFSLWLCPFPTAAQRRPQGRLSGERRSRRQPVSVNPFAAIAREMSRGNSFALNFRRTNFDPKAEATAQVAVREQTLLVLMRARNIPPPSYFNQRRYTLWAFLPNYNQRLYIGDLPIVTRRVRRLAQRRGANLSDAERGTSETAFRFTALPRGAVFGGLVLAAEPARFVPVPIETTQPLLAALTPEGEADTRIASTLNATRSSSPPPSPPSMSAKRVGESAVSRKAVRPTSPRRSRRSTRARTRRSRRHD